MIGCNKLLIKIFLFCYNTVHFLYSERLGDKDFRALYGEFTIKNNDKKCLNLSQLFYCVK